MTVRNGGLPKLDNSYDKGYVSPHFENEVGEATLMFKSQFLSCDIPLARCTYQKNNDTLNMCL